VTRHEDEAITPDNSAEDWITDLGYIEQPTLSSGRRCGIVWDPWMRDWFTSWSPRNANENAEGPWDHWVDLALMILADPMTKIVRPDAFTAGPEPVGFYDETQRKLTVEELRTRFERDCPARIDDNRSEETC